MSWALTSREQLLGIEAGTVTAVRHRPEPGSRGPPGAADPEGQAQRGHDDGGERAAGSGSFPRVIGKCSKF